jgi:hypothetical protein
MHYVYNISSLYDLTRVTIYSMKVILTNKMFEVIHVNAQKYRENTVNLMFEHLCPIWKHNLLISYKTDNTKQKQFSLTVHRNYAILWYLSEMCVL